VVFAALQVRGKVPENSRRQAPAKAEETAMFRAGADWRVGNTSRSHLLGVHPGAQSIAATLVPRYTGWRLRAPGICGAAHFSYVYC
jgi:hypothetical protein